MRYSVDWRALVGPALGIVAVGSGAVLVISGASQRAPVTTPPPPIAQLPLTIPVNQDGSLPTCSTLTWRDKVWTAVCFGNRGEEWLIERRPGDPVTYVLPWPRAPWLDYVP